MNPKDGAAVGRCPYCDERIPTSAARCAYCAEPLGGSVDDRFAFSPAVDEPPSPRGRFLSSPGIAWGPFVLAALASVLLVANRASLAARLEATSRELASYRDRYAEEVFRASALQDEVDHLRAELKALEVAIGSCRDAIEDYRLGVGAVGKMLDSMNAGYYILATYHAGRADRLFGRAETAATACLAVGGVV